MDENKVEKIVPGIRLPDGSTIYPTGIEWLIAFAIKGCGWAIKALGEYKMEANYLLCDICKKQLERSERIYIVTGRSPDPAGGPSELDQEIVDLCPQHMARAINLLCKDNDMPYSYNYERGKRLINWVRENARKYK